MGVMPCHRGDCEHILCSRLILNGSQYICDECWKELLALKKTWPENMKASEVKQAILDFMETDPECSDTSTVDEAFEKLTGYKEEED